MNRAQKRAALATQREIERTAVQASARATYPVLTRNRQHELDEAIWQGEMRLRTGRDSTGKRLTPLQLVAVQRSVDSAHAELEEL